MDDGDPRAAQRVGKHVLLRVFTAEALVLVVAVRAVGQVAFGAVRVQDEDLRPAPVGGAHGICTAEVGVQVYAVIGGVVQVQRRRVARLIPAQVHRLHGQLFALVRLLGVVRRRCAAFLPLGGAVRRGGDPRRLNGQVCIAPSVQTERAVEHARQIVRARIGQRAQQRGNQTQRRKEQQQRQQRGDNVFDGLFFAFRDVHTCIPPCYDIYARGTGFMPAALPFPPRSARRGTRG